MFRFTHSQTEPREFIGQLSLASLILILTMGVSIGLSISLIGALMPSIALDLQLADSQAGIVQSIFFLGHIGGVFFARRFLANWSGSRLWLTAGWASAVGVTVCAGGNYGCLILGRCLAGFGLSLTVILASSTLVTLAGARSGSLLSSFHAVVAASAAATMAFAPQLAAHLGTWQVTVAGCGFLCVCPLAMLVVVKMPNLLPSNSGDRRHGQHGTAAFFALILIVAAYVATEQIVTAFLPLLLSERLSATTAAQITALFWAGVIIGRLVAAMSTSQGFEKLLMLAGGFMMTASLVVLTSSTTTWVIAPFAFLAGFGGGPLVPLGFSHAAKWGRDTASSVLACQAACFAGGFCGPTAMGFAAQGYGLKGELVALFGLAPAITCVLLCICLYSSNWIAIAQSARGPIYNRRKRLA